VAADRVAGDRDAGRVEVLLRAVPGDPGGDGVGFLDRGGVLGLRREAVVREHHGCAGADRELADQPVVGVGVAEHPARAVDVDDDRQRAGRVARAQDADRHLAGRPAGHPRVGDVDVGLGDVAGLHLVDGLATLLGAEVEQEGRVGGRVREPLGGEFEHWLAGHGGSPYLWPGRPPSRIVLSAVVPTSRPSLPGRITAMVVQVRGRRPLLPGRRPGPLRRGDAGKLP
jgi:hypothetical protein